MFGLGALLTVILTGKPPYVGETFESVRVQALRGRLDDCFARLDACGAEPELVALCKKCLAFEPADRPADAGEVAAAVAGLCRGGGRASAAGGAGPGPGGGRDAGGPGAGRRAAAAAADPVEGKRDHRRGPPCRLFLAVAWQWQQAERQKDIAQTAERGEAAQRAIAREEADRATQEADQSRRLLYASDMSLALHAWEAGTIEHARTALERHRPQVGQEDLRGFEWRYLWGLCQDGSKYTLRGHTAGVSAAALAPDGQTLATRGDDAYCAALGHGHAAPCQAPGIPDQQGLLLRFPGLRAGRQDLGHCDRFNQGSSSLGRCGPVRAREPSPSQGRGRAGFFA